jgi:hypothetical protein
MKLLVQVDQQGNKKPADPGKVAEQVEKEMVSNGLGLTLEQDRLMRAQRKKLAAAQAGMPAGQVRLTVPGPGLRTRLGSGPANVFAVPPPSAAEAFGNAAAAKHGGGDTIGRTFDERVAHRRDQPVMTPEEWQMTQSPIQPKY